MKKLTMKDIGILANVSQSTVSRVISGHPNVKEEVRQKVLKCINDTNFMPDINARIMRGESSKILGFLSTGFDNPYYLEMVKYVEKQARDKGYTVIVMNSEKDEKIERQHLKELITRKIDGLIIAPVSVKNLKLAKDSQIPFVVLNEKVTWADSFYTSLFNAGVEVAKFFKEKGYSKVGYIGEINSDKLKGFLSEINKEKIINLEKSNLLFTIEKGFKKKIKFVVEKLDKDCEAFFMSSDEIALAVIKETRKFNINLYEKEIVGFDNTLVADTLEISSVEQPMEQMVEIAVEVLLKKINKEIPMEKIFNIELEPKLIIRPK